jgi:hypothetical protein
MAIFSYPSCIRSACLTLTGLTILALTSGCSSTESYGDWQGTHPRLLPYSKMLIVVDTPYAELRQELEQQLLAGATEGGTLAAAAINLKSGNKAVTQENLVLMLEEAYADSLLLVKFSHRIVAADGDKTTSIDIAPQTVAATDTPLPSLANNSAIVDATVYDIMQGGRPVYVIDIETIFRDKGPDTVYYAAEDISDVILDELIGVKIIDD